jgi:hypothetical protein
MVSISQRNAAKDSLKHLHGCAQAAAMHIIMGGWDIMVFDVHAKKFLTKHEWRWSIIKPSILYTSFRKDCQCEHVQKIPLVSILLLVWFQYKI